MLNPERLLSQGNGLIRASDHPRRRTSLYHLAASGRLRMILPGVFVAPGPIDVETRLRALCLWCPHGILHERTAMALWLGEPCNEVRMATAVRRVPQRVRHPASRHQVGQPGLCRRGVRRP